MCFALRVISSASPFQDKRLKRSKCTRFERGQFDSLQDYWFVSPRLRNFLNRHAFKKRAPLVGARQPRLLLSG
jgi:hypothetical protein